MSTGRNKKEFLNKVELGVMEVLTEKYLHDAEAHMEEVCEEVCYGKGCGQFPCQMLKKNMRFQALELSSQNWELN